MANVLSQPRAAQRGGLVGLLHRYPVPVYFVLAYAISWAGIALLTVPSGIPAEPDQVLALLPFVFLAMAAGPISSSVLVTAVTMGRAGVASLFRRLGRWRVGLVWYAVALFTAPTLILAVLSVLTRFSSDFTPRAMASTDLAAVVAIGVIGGLLAGFLEEMGWTGFPTPRLLRRHSVLVTGLLIGVPWWAWHLLADFWGGAMYGDLYVVHALLWGVALPAYRILMTWVYAYTGSLLVAALMHASFTGGQAIFEPIWTTPLNAVLWYGLFAAALWIVVAGVTLVRSQTMLRPARRPLAYAT